MEVFKVKKRKYALYKWAQDRRKREAEHLVKEVTLKRIIPDPVYVAYF